MAERLQCPTCGRHVTLPERVEGAVAVCVACGTRLTIPAPILQPVMPNSQPAVEDLPSAASEVLFPARVTTAAHRPPAGPVLVACVIAVMMLGGLLAALLLRHSRRTLSAAPSASSPVRVASAADPGLANQVLDLRKQADALRYSGRFTSAAEKYRRIHQLVDGQELADPVLEKLVSETWDEERTTLLVIEKMNSSTASAPPADPGAESDFEPETAAPHPTTSPAASRPLVAQAPNTEPAAPRPPVVLPDHRNRALPPTAAAKITGVTDAQIGYAIERGANFLLAQFKDGELQLDTELSPPQKEALDALCVYALLQAGKSINDPRLKISAEPLNGIVEKLKSYELVSDGKTINRPITYGRSLRSAALATYNRPQDRQSLKADVAWLIAAQIGGAYTYDDLYRQLIQEGLKPEGSQSPDAPPQTPNDPRVPRAGEDLESPMIDEPPEDSGLPVSSDQRACDDGGGGFGGGSPPPTDGGGGPYDPPTSPPPPPPVIIGGHGSPPPPPPGTGIGGGGSGPTIKFPRPMKWIREPLVPFTRPQWWRPNPPPSQPPTGQFRSRVGPGYKPDNLVPPVELTFDFPWDNSNSQYGLLGVWAGAEAGMEVPQQYWKDVERHWLSCELRGGQWAYRKQDAQGYYAMNCAGVASLLVTHDYLDAPLVRGTMGREPYNSGLAAGLAWLEQGDNSVATPGALTHYMGYDLFGMERAGLACGYKFFGSHDWYRQLASKVLPMQWPDGAWGYEDHGVDTLVDTAYTLLFLSRGRHPVLMTKLKFDKYWDNRPRDAANLARFAGRELERPLNWQVVGIEHPWYDWFDSPVLYIASHQPPHFSEADYAKLRNFIMAGGMIFTHADGSSIAFNRWVPELARRIAPDGELKPIPDHDPILTLQYKLTSHPRLLGVSNGVRWLLIHSSGDIALAWQQRSEKTQWMQFQLGTNIFLYASGKPDLRNRIDSPYIPPPPAPPAKFVSIARVKYAGNWDPEPAAWYRFSRYLQWETGEAADVRAVQIADLPTTVAQLATLTGTAAHSFTDGERASLRKFVESGGILLIDACGGENAFTQSARDDLLHNAFSGAAKVPLPADHPLYKDLKPGLSNPSPVRLRPYAIDRLGNFAPPIQLLKLGKGYVLFSAMDLTSALLGTNTWGIIGYEPASAQVFVKNMVLWSEAR